MSWDATDYFQCAAIGCNAIGYYDTGWNEQGIHLVTVIVGEAVEIEVELCENHREKIPSMFKVDDRFVRNT
jgi:hypothetical protein